MDALEPPDSNFLEAAQGWLDLGAAKEAVAELDRISAENRAHPEVLQMKWRVCSSSGQWEVCLATATELTQVAPDRRFGWLHLAFSLDRLNRTAEARQLLLSVVDRFEPTRRFPIIWRVTAPAWAGGKKRSGG